MTFGNDQFLRCWVLGVLALLLGMGGAVSAAQFGDFTYTDDGTSITITGYPDSVTGAVIIPASIEGVNGSKPVTGIGTNAFFGCNKLTSVAIPESVTNIGNSAFSGCSKLTSMTVPSGVMSLSDSVFSYCEGLKNVTIPSSVTSIGNRTFSSCRELTSILLPAGVTSIGDYSFSDCWALTDVSIPQGVLSLGRGAFFYCTQLKRITIPSSIGSMGSGVFSACSRLESITVDPGNPNFSSEDGILFDKLKTSLIKCPQFRSGKYVIPSSVKTLESESFGNCEGLTSVTIPASVTTMGDFVFAYCSGLKSVEISEGCTRLGHGAFYRCVGLSSVVIPSTMISLADEAFYVCSGLTAVTIMPGVARLEYLAFGFCENLTSVSIPSSVKIIEDNVFSGCGKLKNVDFMGDAPESIGTRVFLYTAWDFTIYYFKGASGFTSPTWMGYPTAEMAPEIELRRSGSVNLLDGGNPETFGSVIIGNSSAITYTITNVGKLDLTGLSAAKSGANPDDYQVSTLATTTLAPGASTSIQVSFNPAALGTRMAIIQIASNDADENPFHIQLTGDSITVLVPEVAVDQSAGNDLIDGLFQKDFGAAVVGYAGTKTTFTIRNTGTGNLTGLAVSKSGRNAGDYQFSALASTTLAPGASMTFDVTFMPTALGTRLAEIHIASNDSDESSFDIQMIGTAIGIQEPEIVIEQPSGNALVDGSGKKSFGAAIVGKRGDVKTFTIKNAGNAVLSGLAVTKNGAASKDFTVTALSKNSLAPGGSTSFKVTFKPTAKGKRSAAIHIKSNDTDENPFDISLAGTGMKLGQ